MHTSIWSNYLQDKYKTLDFHSHGFQVVDLWILMVNHAASIFSKW